MICRECGSTCERLDNEHLLRCSGLTLQEYAIRQHMPLDLLVHADQVNTVDRVADYPLPSRHAGEAARATLQGLRWAGLLREVGEFVEIPGEIRRLDQLLWDREQLADYGFRFRQEYRYSTDTHRVVAHNLLRVPQTHLRHGPRWASPEPPPSFRASLAVLLAHRGESHAGYLFLPFARAAQGDEARDDLRRRFAVECVSLDAADADGGCLLRTRTIADSERLIDLLREHLAAIPGAHERLTAPMPQATVSKELVFDAAHFITDHPAKCSNLHGGRYQLHVEVSGRIDPCTGCVVDYGYLKRVVNRQVIERFDHHNLNYAAAELAWRSSTEMLCVYIWEALIDYLPGLSGLRLYETTQSWCDYRGPTLAEHQLGGSSPLLHAFDQVDGAQRRRRLLGEPSKLRAVAGLEVS